MHRELPIGHHDAQQMSELLGFKNKLRFYKKLRELGWLIVDKNGVRCGRHNLPKKHIVDLGYAYELKCSYGKGENKEKDGEYSIPVFTQTGLEALKKILQDGAPPQTVLANKVEALPLAPQNYDRKASERERRAALNALKEMGIF